MTSFKVRTSKCNLHRCAVQIDLCCGPSPVEVYLSLRPLDPHGPTKVLRRLFPIEMSPPPTRSEYMRLRRHILITAFTKTSQFLGETLSLSRVLVMSSPNRPQFATERRENVALLCTHVNTTKQFCRLELFIRVPTTYERSKNITRGGPFCRTPIAAI